MTVAATGRAGGAALLTVVTATAFVTMLDNTVVTVAAPSIAADLHTPLSTLEWVATGYMLAFAGLLLAGGRLADRYGPGRVLRAGLLVFAAGSLAAALSRAAVALVAARVGQGVGAALLVPATLAALAAAGERERRRGAAVWTLTAGVALALGPVLGGVLSQHVHWSAIFWLNLPVCVLTAFAAGTGLPATGAPRQGGLDLPGVLTSTVALFALTYALTAGPAHGWRGPAAAAGGIAVAAGVGFVLAERRGADPMIDLSLLAAPGYAGGLAVQVLWGLGVNGVYFYTALYLQDVRGFGPTAAGLAFLPIAVAVVAGTPLAGRLVDRAGYGPTVACGLVLVAAGMVGVAAGGGLTPLLLVAFTLIGFGSALTVPLAAAVLAAAPANREGVAAGLFTVCRELSGVFGIAGIGIFVAAGGLRTGYRTGLIAAAALVLAAAAISRRALPGAPAAGQPTSTPQA
jgi:EmrB/QacA subfamily drug resistance transporter